MRVFIAGKMYVGVVGASARRRDVWPDKMTTGRGTRTYDEVIAQAGCDLGEGVCGARRDEDDVCPAPQFDVEDGVADGVCPL